ncbi:GNAT family N-acetyltransferase [Rhodoferax sp.]|uniref:GNAT family N-acetyltransferase n=1 Tax=Rhodoferax sp. TaxID=50421 RepID=UPI00277B2D00|nr:GNAT family N-acetyltransferase [Rhodoferax sp.]
MPHWSIIQLDGTLGVHAPAWDALNRRQFQANPMLDSRFVEGLLRHFGDGSVRLCVLETDKGPQAMCLLRPKGLGIWTTFLPAQAQIGPVLISDARQVRPLIRQLPGLVGQIDFLCHDPAFGAVALPASSDHSTQEHALTMSIRLDGDFETYWAKRSKQLQKNIRRYERRLDEDGQSARVVCISDSDAIGAAVDRYATLESKGWKGLEGTAIGSDNVQGRFYGEVLRGFCSSGGATVYELWIGERLAASRLTIASATMLVILKTTYDEVFDKYAPGRLLLRGVVEQAFKLLPGGVIEFYTDANPDQLSWATDQRWIEHVSVYRNDLAATLIPIANALRKSIVPVPDPLAEHGAGRRVEVLYHPSQFPADLHKLFALAERDDFQCGAAWYSNLTDAVFADHAGVRFYVLRQGEQAIAVLPVQIVQHRQGKQVESLSNYYTALYAPALAPGLKARDLVPLIRAVLSAHAPVASLRFAPMDPRSQAYRLLFGGLREAGLAPFAFFCFVNWHLAAFDDWAGYLASRHGSLRNTIKRMGKKFAHDGGTLELIQGGDALDRGIGAYEQVYARSWKKPEPYPAFVPGLARTCAASGWLRLGVAWIDGKPVAAQIWIVSNGRASIYKLAYDEDYKSYAPGTLLTALLMQHVMEEDQVLEVDYLIGNDPYKQAWMNRRRERWGIVAYNSKTLSGALGMCQEALARPLKLIIAKLRGLFGRTDDKPRESAIML